MPEALPLSLLNDFLFCPRRAALKIVEGWRSANVHTVRGDIAHEHADLPGYEVAKGATLLRALPVFSNRLGLSGKCDIVEQRTDGSYFPVEFKVGKRREFENDDVQLCAQALCLEEMLGVAISRGAIFHAQSKRRREVEFNADLRARTEQAAADVHQFLTNDSVPPASHGEPEPALLTSCPTKTSDSVPPARYVEGRCEECSLFEICLPRLTQAPAAAATAAASRRLYQT
jgi:CRISPR-associated exonuclease Cas4